MGYLPGFLKNGNIVHVRTKHDKRGDVPMIGRGNDVSMSLTPGPFLCQARINAWIPFGHGAER